MNGKTSDATSPSGCPFHGSAANRGCPSRSHGSYPHDIIPPRSRYFAAGRFGRMFGELPPFARDTAEIRQRLIEIGKYQGIMDAKDELTDPRALIVDENLQTHNENNRRMSAGMTFLGQFLDHDMTFDPTSSLERQTDPEQIANYRTPTFGLDSVYGSGPAASPHLYDRHSHGMKLLTEIIPGSGTPERHDLPRNSQDMAVIGDPRNDENLVVSQLQLAFLRFHNAVVDHLIASGEVAGLDSAAIFAEAQRTVRWHYQWMILHEFLPLTCGASTVRDVLENGRKFYDWRNEPFIPVEFSVACYRYGHSQVRPSYRANFTGGTGGSELFQFIFKADEDHSSPENDDLSGSCRRPWRFIDWRTFFDFKDGKMRHNKKIDTTLSSPLFRLPGSVVPDPDDIHNPRSLAARNLLRHLTFSLPSGQRVAKAMKAKLPGLELLSEDDLADLKPFGMHDRTPLWFYVLREADVCEEGVRLGPVGGRIVAEVFIGLMEGDSQSYLTQDADWKPTLPTFNTADQGEKFSIVDLLHFAGVA